MIVNTYSTSWNEQMLIPYYYKWYKERFPDVVFNIYDNESSDLTVWISNALGMKGHTINTGNKFDEIVNMYIKSKKWVDTDSWVICCDIDEWIDINEDQLKYEASKGTTVIRTQGFDMCNINNTISLFDIKHGIRNTNYDKSVMFYAPKIKDMQYTAGCHKAYPVGEVVQSQHVYNLYHMKYWSKSYFVSRYLSLQKRQSDGNIRKNYGIHYMKPAQELEAEYDNMIANAIQVRP